MHLLTSLRKRALALVGCGAALLGSGTVHAAPRELYLLSTDDRLAIVSETGAAAPVLLPIVGITAGYTLAAIDVRPMNQRLYGLGYNGAGAVQLYLLEPRENDVVAAAVGTTGTFVNAGGLELPITGSAFGIDFNPAADRLRVVTETGFNFRMNPNTGTLVDGDFGGPQASVVGVNPDGQINGFALGAEAAAYTNNRITSPITTLYTLSATANALYIQNPPNGGTQVAATAVTLGGAPLDFTAAAGLDIPQGVNAPASNVAATGPAYASLTVAGTASLYRIELSTGAATLLRGFGALAVRDIAVAGLEGTAMTMPVTGTSVSRFSLENTGVTITSTLTGISAGETLVGIDLRPQTGTVLALGIDAAANDGTLYLVDPQTGACLPIGAPGQIAFVQNDGISPVDFPATDWGFDVNPAVDRVRVTSRTGALNFRVNPNTGAPVDGNAGAGIQVDSSVGGGVGVSGAAYTNARAGSLVGGVTTLYTLNALNASLAIQSPPNEGTQTTVAGITDANGPLAFAPTLGFDIPRGVNAPASNAPASGLAYAVLTVGPQTALYRINLASGAASVVSTIAGGATPMSSLITFGAQREVLFSDGFE